jgi:pimeloyl-ACP methyl ester carboxylesterase
MKNQINKIVIIFIIFSSIIGYGQINYGSNNGKNLTIKGTKIYYEEYGEGPSLLLLHGGFGDISSFKHIIPKLSEHFHLILPDSPGHGRSEFPSEPLSFQIMAEYNSDMIDKLKLDSVYVLGFSDGGNSGLLLANYRPDKVKKLLVSGANYKSKAYIGMEEFKETILNVEWIESNWNEWIVDYKKTSPSGDWKRFITEGREMWLAEEYFSKNILEEISIPVLVVYGDNDSVIIEHGIEIKNAIKNSQLCILPNTTHSVFGKKNDLIINILQDFFIDE